MISRTFSTRGLMSHRVDDSGDLILHDTSSGEMVVLNPVGAAAYDMIDGSRNEDAIAQEIAEAFPDIAAAAVKRDVCEFLDDLARRGLIIPIAT